MFKSINESLDKLCCSKKKLCEGKIRVDVNLGNRVEHVPFDSRWAAELKAKDYAKSSDVKFVEVIDTDTGEVLFSSKEEKSPINESKTQMASMLKKFNTAYNWMYENKFPTYDLMIEGEELMKSMPDKLKEFVDFRGDMLTSDREVAAFTCALGYAGQVVDIDEYANNLRDKYQKAYQRGMLSYAEAKTAVYKKVSDMMKALNIMD